MRHWIQEVAMAVPQEIVRLIERYNAQREAYESGQYKETEMGTFRMCYKGTFSKSRNICIKAKAGI